MLSAEGYAELRGQFERLPGQAFVAQAEALLQAHGDDARVWFLLGAARHRQEQLEPALEAFDRVLALQPEHVQALNAKAGLLGTLGRTAQARALLEEGRRRFPGDATVLVNLGYLLEQQETEREEALACYDAALRLQPSNRAALMNRGYLLTLMRRLPEAVGNNRQLVAHHPQLAVAHFNLAESLLAAMQSEEALRASEHALSIEPSHADACMVRGLALSELGRLDEGGQAIEQARALDARVLHRALGIFEANKSLAPPPPEPEAIFLHRGFQHLQVCEWSRRELFLQEFEARVSGMLDAGRPVRDFSFAYYPLATPVDPALHARLMRRLASQFEESARAGPPAPGQAAPAGKRLRIGYVSPDFREHLNARLTYPIFRQHDRRRFEVHCYSLHADDGSEIRRMVASSADRFVDVSGRTSAEMAGAIRADGIDILVDLAGMMANAQPEVLAHRPAPVQVSYLGFPGTLGADYIQYRITDRMASPPGQRAYWTEALAYLPATFYVYDEAEPLAAVPVSRRDYGLPEHGIVFCAFHNYYKIDPEIYDRWAAILRRVEGSALWLPGWYGVAVENLKREAAARGIAPDRLCFAPLESRERYRARFGLADLYLDTRRFTAMTTACDALWAGLPILTSPGESFPSRVCASLLQASGLAECILPDLQSYEEEAVRLACDAEALQRLKARVADCRTGGALFDSGQRVAELEQAFEQMWQRHRSGLPPADFDVARAAPPEWRNPWH